MFLIYTTAPPLKGLCDCVGVKWVVEKVSEFIWCKVIFIVFLFFF